MTQELSPSATETPFEDKLVPKKYLARLRKQADAIGDTALALELEAAASKLNAFSATDIHCAHRVIHYNTPSRDHKGRERDDGFPRDLRDQKIRDGIFGNTQDLEALEKILEEAESLVATVAPAEKRFDATVQKLREARNAMGLDEDGQPLSDAPKPPVHEAHEFYATPLSSYAVPAAANNSTPNTSSVSHTSAPSAVANLFPESTNHILSRKRNSPPSAVDVKSSAPEGFAARMEALCLKPRITHAARWQELQSIAKELKEQPVSPAGASTEEADRQAWRAFNQLMALNSDSNPKQELHRVQLFAQAFRADAKARDAIQRSLPVEASAPLDDYFSALTDIYRQDIGVEDGWKEVEALYQNIKQQHFSKSSGNGHLKINDINAKLQSVLVGMFEHDQLTPEQGLPLLSNVLEELYDDVRAIDAHKGFYSQQAEKTPDTGQLGSTALTSKWLEMLPSTKIERPQRGGYYGKYRTAAEFDAAQKSRRNWDKKFAGGVGILGLLGVPAAYLMRPQVPTHSPNETYVPEMSATPQRSPELWRDSSPTPMPPYTPPSYDVPELPPLPADRGSNVDYTTQEVDTPYGPMPRDLWEMTQDADRRFGRRHISPEGPAAATETPPAPSAFDEAFNNGSTTTDAPAMDPELPPATNEPDSTPPADATAPKISVRGHKGGYAARFSMKGESFAEKALAPDSTTVTFRS